MAITRWVGGFGFGRLLSGVLLLAPGICPAGEMHAIVEVDSGFVLGATADKKWLKDGEAAKALKGGETYRVYGLDKPLGQVTGGKPEEAGAPFEGVNSVTLTPKPEDGVLAICADWDALPRRPKITSTTQPAYVEAMRAFLEAQGIKKPEVKMTQVLRVDLDGDGEEEVLISATNYFKKDGSVPSKSPEGSYSFVLMRKVVAGTVQTKLIAGEFHPKPYSGPEGFHDAPSRYLIAGVLDLKGDGKMEVVVKADYYEGGERTVYDCLGDKPTKVLSVGGGA